MESKEESDHLPPLTPLYITAETEGKRLFVRDVAVDFSRTGHDEKQGPASEVNMGKLLVGYA